MSNGNNCAPPFVFPSWIVIRAPLLDRRLNSTAVRQDICALYIGEEVTGCRAGMAQSVLRNLSPMWAGPRDWRIDGDPKRLRICFHSEWSPSAWLEREPTKLEKTLSNDRWDSKKKSVRLCGCRCVGCVYLCRQCVSIDPQSSSTFWKTICQMGIHAFMHRYRKKHDINTLKILYFFSQHNSHVQLFQYIQPPCPTKLHSIPHHQVYWSSLTVFTGADESGLVKTCNRNDQCSTVYHNVQERKNKANPSTLWFNTLIHPLRTNTVLFQQKMMLRLLLFANRTQLLPRRT